MFGQDECTFEKSSRGERCDNFRRDNRKVEDEEHLGGKNLSAKRNYGGKSADHNLGNFLLCNDYDKSDNDHHHMDIGSTLCPNGKDARKHEWYQRQGKGGGNPKTQEKVGPGARCQMPSTATRDVGLGARGKTLITATSVKKRPEKARGKKTRKRKGSGHPRTQGGVNRGADTQGRNAGAHPKKQGERTPEDAKGK